MNARSVLDFLFPTQCGGCEAAGSGLCERCLPYRAPLTRNLPTVTVTALGVYEGGLRRAVLALKSGRRDVAEAFAFRLRVSFPCPATVVPVPTTAARRRQRGFDGCELIARLAFAERAPVFAQLMQVRGDSQRGLGREARWRARMRFKWRGQRLDGRAIVLLDDVVTTGATLEECAGEVRSAGGVVMAALAVAIA